MSSHFQRGLTIKIILPLLVVAVIAFGVWFVTGRRPPEASYQGKSASVWLYVVFGSGSQSQALEAFHHIGTNAEPVLLDALEGRESLSSAVIRRFYYRVPFWIQRHLTPPQPLWIFRDRAELVILNTPLPGFESDLLSLLAKPDSDLRRTVLNVVENHLGPNNAGQLAFLTMAASDTNEFVRLRSLYCLAQIGPTASNAVAVVTSHCTDADIGVRTAAARATWKITGQTNLAVPTLERVLSQTKFYTDRHWAACYLFQGPDSVLVWTFIGSLSSPAEGIRMSACACLGQIGPAASNAVPALRVYLNDPDQEMRRRVRLALARIDPQHAAAPAPN